MTQKGNRDKAKIQKKTDINKTENFLIWKYVINFSWQLNYIVFP
nr:MAG TPA: hypothetical protein [Caudoviricetes sp.]